MQDCATIDQCCPQIEALITIWEADQGFFFHLLVFILCINMIEPNTVGSLIFRLILSDVHVDTYCLVINFAIHSILII